MVTVDLLNVTIAPSKFDGREWDGLPNARVPEAVRAAVRGALGMTNGHATVVGILANLANSGTKPPDVQGGAVMFFGSQAVGPAQMFPKVQDSFTPPTFARWSHVPLDDRVRIRIHLEDADLQFDDPIGDVELNVAHLAAALQAGSVYQVRVDDQNPQVLFVGVSVRREQ